MATNNRKQILFDKLSSQLRLLKDNGLISVDLKYDKTYICPICLNQFSEADLDCTTSKNCLTEEDAPPDSLGGSRIALTCKKCNSECGHKIDFHLKELIEKEENSKFVKGSIQTGTIDFNGNPITVQMTSDGGGKLQALHDEKRNNPSVSKEFIKSIKSGKLIDFRPKKSRVDGKKVNYALLKTNYIITFSKFGYIFLLDSAYDKIREQILNPNKEIIKYNLAIHNTHLKDHIGTNYVLDKGVKSILNIFNLKTKLTEKAFGAFLPIPIITIDRFVSEMEKRIVNHVAVFNKSEYDPKVDLFNDLNEIKKIRNWTNNEN
jgi:hypothetical protein